MDGDGSGFSFSSATDYTKGQDTSDISWADIFLDGIHSDDPITSETGNTGDTSGLAAGIHGGGQQVHHQAQSSIMGGQLQIHIPAQLQGSLASNTVAQGGAKLCGTVTYLAPSAAAQQHVNTAGQIQNMMTVGGHHQVAASIGQQQQQNSAKLVQIAPSFPVTSLGNTVPLQTLIQPGQTLAGQTTIYGSQGGGLFPAQGSVHIENPKVVNVNFGPPVIGSDGSGQQAIIQTSEGKRVLITNSQLQHMSQSISLTQPLVGTQLINTGGGNVIRASLAPGTHTIMPSTATPSRQIVLPSGHTMIPQQTNTTAGGIAKNVVLRQLNPNMSSVIYQSGQGGQLIHSQPTLISSGSGLQVVNTGGSHSNQVQLIAQPAINQTSIGQQQGTVMNLINGSGSGNQITGLVPGQNIFVNGQVLSIGQLGSLAVPQLQVQQNSQGSVTLADINAAQFQATAPHLVIQQAGQQQQQLVLQPKNNPSPSFMTNAVLSHRLISNLPPSGKTARTPTPNASSASSTPVMTPTPSTPTPTPTPELISDFSGGKGSQGIDIFKQALDMSDIDLQSFEDDINFLDDTASCFSTLNTQSASQAPVLPVKTAVKPTKSKSKTSKSKSKNVQPTGNVTMHNTSLQQSIQEQSINLSTQQKVVTANGQVYILSGNSFVLQPSASSASHISGQVKPVASTTVATTTNSTQARLPASYQLEPKGQVQQRLNPGTFSNLSFAGQIKVEPSSIPVCVEQNHVFPFASLDTDSKTFIKASPTGCMDFITVSSAPSAVAGLNAFTSAVNSQAAISSSTANLNPTQNLYSKNQKISTLAGAFVKQKPAVSVIKQETMDFNQPVSSIQSCNQVISSIQSSPHMAATSSTASFSSFPSPASSFSASSSPLVISSSSSAVTTTITQSHQITIMSTSHLASSQQDSVSTTSTTTSTAYQPHSSAFSSSSTLLQNADCHAQNLNTGLLHTSSTALPSAVSSARSSSKERDPANVKTMIPVRIADCTLMLSLTPGEKERLENKLSQMSQRDQEEFLMHQQSLIRRSQQMQMEQQLKQQQHKQLLLLKQPQPPPPPEFQQQELAQQPQKRILPSQLPAPPLQSDQPQLALGQSYPPAAKFAHAAPGNSLPELLPPPAAGLPTTVQELIEKPEEDLQMGLQPFSAQKAAEQQPQQHRHHTPSPQHQQPMYSNLLPRTVPLSQQQHFAMPSQPGVQPQFGMPPQAGASMQPFGMPQIGRCLAEQQLLRDRTLAVEPDVSSPFKSLSDAMRRLVRYHTLQDHKPQEGSKAYKIWDAKYSKLCDYLVRKKRCYIRRFNKMMLYGDLCQEKQTDYIQNLMCFNEQLRAVIDSEKEEAANNPDLFDPTKPGLFRRSGTTTSVDNSENSSFVTRTPTDSRVPDLKHRTVPVQVNRPPASDRASGGSLYSQSSSLKRTAPEKGSSGMLKLVIKRRTMDNFIVKNSVGDVQELPSDLRPIVDVERSDSEYEFDTSAAVSQNQPVIVRRRTLSLTSHQASFDARSDSGSASSHTEEIACQLSEEDDEEEEEDMDEARDESNGEEETEEKSCDDNDDDFVEDKLETKRRYLSFGGEIDNNQTARDSDDSDSVDADAFMETDERLPEKAAPYYEVSTGGSVEHTFTASDHQADAETHDCKNRSSSSSVSHNASVAPDGVLNPGLSYSVGSRDFGSDYKVCSVGESVKCDKFSFGTSADNASTRYCVSSRVSLPAAEEEEEGEEYVAESPVSCLEKEAARTGLPSSSLFTTPNKNLLATDAMFNSEDEDEIPAGARMVSKFEIDNKDPQSSMIDESVRSVIDSVLNDDADDDKGSQNSWTLPTHKLSSSSGHRNIFQFSASVLIPPGHESNLDLSVPRILKS